MTGPRTVAWWLYALLSLALGYGQLVRKILTDTGGPGSRIGPPLVATILALGVLSALRGTPFLRPWVWQAVFWALAAASVGGVALSALLLFEGATSMAAAVLVLAAFLVPGEIQLFRYAFRRADIWAGGE